MAVITRFAPSPTGDLHIGSVRTALFCWLYARHHGGKMILRIEDTDKERSTQEAIDIILEGLKWLGIEYDDGPYYQTKHFDRYQALTQLLLEQGKAYRCYCSKERLDKLRTEQLQKKQKPRYDGHCRPKPGKPEPSVSASHSPHFVVRFCNPLEGEVIFRDHVYGEICIRNQELDDLIIARSDGSPTYNFTVVVDDWDMGITHVIRGDDHINNTPRQINIFKALGAPIPEFVHLPIILGKDGKKLSKRDGTASVLQFRDEGFIKEAMLNYLVRLGWSYSDKEIFSIPEMIELFDTKNINKSAAAFDKEKLLWLNQHYLKACSPTRLIPCFRYLLDKAGLSERPDFRLEELIRTQSERCKTLKEMVDKSWYFFQSTIVFDEKAAQKNLTIHTKPVLEYLCEEFKKLSAWDSEHMTQILVACCTHCELALGQVAQPLRVAITGNTSSPPIDLTLFLLGREWTLSRIAAAIHYIDTHSLK